MQKERWLHGIMSLLVIMVSDLNEEKSGGSPVALDRRCRLMVAESLPESRLRRRRRRRHVGSHGQDAEERPSL